MLRRFVRVDLALACFLGLSTPAQAAAPQTPVIVVPGIVGSNLCEAPTAGSAQPGKQLWGSGLFYMGRLSQLKLPLEAGGKETPVVPCGLLESFAVLGPFEIDVYSGLISFLKRTGYRENETLFVFDYDWRRSNFKTAEILSRHVAEIKARTGQPKVHIIAHSMGGIISRVYLQTLGGANDVDGMVFLGTPHQGATQVLRTANDGWGWLPNFIVGGEDVIRNSLFSWPAVYELIPLADCCVRLGPNQVQQRLSLLDVNNWARIGWLPHAYRTNKGLAFIREQIGQSARLRKVLNDKLPQGPFYEFIASESYATAKTAVFDPALAKVVRFLETRGDESVTLPSASNGDIPRARLVGEKHATIFDDELAHFYIASAIRLDAPELIAKFAVQPGAPKRDLRFDAESSPADVCAGLTKDQLDPYKEGSVQAVLIADDGSRVCIHSFRLRTSERAAPVETELTATLQFSGYSASFARALSPTLGITNGAGGIVLKGVAPRSFTLLGVGGEYRALYEFTFKAPHAPGIYRVDADQGGLRDHAASAVLIAYPGGQ